jgi:hypothetical protein
MRQTFGKSQVLIMPEATGALLLHQRSSLLHYLTEIDFVPVPGLLRAEPDRQKRGHSGVNHIKTFFLRR